MKNKNIKNSQRERTKATFLESQDAFGHKINLNFDRSQTSLNTSCGGCVTLLIKVAIVSLATFQTFHLFSTSGSTVYYGP